jgi:F-type H+-transporting ATPase subunit alpha
MIIWALTNGFIDDIPTNTVREWERGLHEFMKSKYPQVGDALRSGKPLKDVEADLKRGIEDYKKGPGAPKTDAPRVEAAVK